MRSRTGVSLSLRHYYTQAPSGEITHTFSAKFKVSSHPMHLLLRSLTGVLLSLRYHHIQGTFWCDHSQVFCLVSGTIACKTPSGEIIHRCFAKFKALSHSGTFW